MDEDSASPSALSFSPSFWNGDSSDDDPFDTGIQQCVDHGRKPCDLCGHRPSRRVTCPICGKRVGPVCADGCWNEGAQRCKRCVPPGPPEPDPEPLPEPPPADFMDFFNMLCEGLPPRVDTIVAKRQRVDPPVAQLVQQDRNAKELADLVAYRNEQRAREAEREKRFAPKPKFPYCKRLIDDGSVCRGIDFEPHLKLAGQNSFFIEVAELPPLYLPYAEAFAHAEATVSARIHKLGAQGHYKLGVSRCPSPRFLMREPHGYFELGYRRMCVVFAGPSTWAAELEMRLIATRRNVDGRCTNNSVGGENVPSDGQGRLVYIAESPRGLGLESREHQVMAHRLECLSRCFGDA